MPAEIIEAQPEDNTLDQLPTDETARSPDELIEEFSGTTTAPEGSNPFTEEDNLPDKYRGKSIKEVVAMHQEAERLIGSQGSEVGELRKVVDQFILNQSQPPPQVEEEVPETDFFEDPKTAVNRAIEQHPTVKAANQQAELLRRQTTLQQLQTKHPDIAQIGNDPAFVNWVKESPMRVEMYNRANTDYDVMAADELFTTWKERQGIVQQHIEAEQAARKADVRRASTGGAATGANTSGAKRVYRRADIIKLMKTDPERYEALSGEILQAYAEGRVK